MSQPVKVEVYAPPQIHPHDLFLAPGASYVVCSTNLVSLISVTLLLSMSMAGPREADSVTPRPQFKTML